MEIWQIFEKKNATQIMSFFHHTDITLRGGSTKFKSFAFSKFQNRKQRRHEMNQVFTILALDARTQYAITQWK